MGVWGFGIIAQSYAEIHGRFFPNIQIVHYGITYSLFVCRGAIQLRAISCSKLLTPRLPPFNFDPAGLTRVRFQRAESCFSGTMAVAAIRAGVMRTYETLVSGGCFAMKLLCNSYHFAYPFRAS
jgi:hypothetical protein